MKIDILTRKDKPDEEKMIPQIRKVIEQAAQLAHKQVEVNVTSDFRQFEGISINVSATPIIIINGIAEFSSGVPKVEVLRQKMLDSSEGGASGMF